MNSGMIPLARQVVSALYAELEAWWKDTGAKFPVKNPDFDASKWWQAGSGKEE
jgi:hypothetical protein